MEPKWSHPRATPLRLRRRRRLRWRTPSSWALASFWGSSVMINVGNNVQALGMGHGDGGAAHREKRGKTNDGGSHTTRLRNSRRAV